MRLHLFRNCAQSFRVRLGLTAGKLFNAYDPGDTLLQTHVTTSAMLFVAISTSARRNSLYTTLNRQALRPRRADTATSCAAWVALSRRCIGSVQVHAASTACSVPNFDAVRLQDANQFHRMSSNMNNIRCFGEYAAHLIGDVKDTGLDFLIYFACCVDERLLQSEDVSFFASSRQVPIATSHLLTSSTLCAVFADVSRNTSPCSLANVSPSSVDTARRCCRQCMQP